MATDEVREARGGSAARLAAEIAEAERQERERLAEALHDDALQRLLVARQDLAEGSQDPAVLRSVRVQLDELTESLRTLTAAMCEEGLAALPLGLALERLADDAARRGRFVISTHVAPAAAGDHDPFVVAVVRELLANVVKHAQASRVEVVVTADDEAVVVRVADDGRGVEEDAVEAAGRAGHMGHARLHRRLAAIGGALQIDASPAAGTTVTCVLPTEHLLTQRTLEDALRRERRWSAALVAAMQDGFAVVRDGRVVQVNDRLSALTGFGQDVLLGAGGIPFWPDERREALSALLGDARHVGGTETRSPIVRADGSRFEALVSARAIHDDAGGDAGTLLTLKDITALELAEERRRRERELGAVVATTNRLRGLIEAARAVTDPVGLDALLREIARTISEDLGWVVVVYLYRPAWDDFVVATGHGVAPEDREALEGAPYEWAEWTPLLDDRYERRGAFLAPAGDGLLIPFRHADGHFLGILSLDVPTSGRRPSDAELDVLVAVAAHAALAVQLAQTAIESARHAAALERLLDVSSQVAGTREIAPMLDVVTAAIADALGFGRVLVEVVDRDGMLVPRAHRDGAVAAPVGDLLPLAPQALAGVLEGGGAGDGCIVLGREEAAAHVPEARRALLASRTNGRGWRAWDDHVIVVPMHDPDGGLAGVVWVGDPADRLLPGDERLQALHAFAGRAAAVIAAERRERPEPKADGEQPTQLGDRRTFLRELDREVARTTRMGGSSMLVLAEVSGGSVGDGAELAELAAAFEAELRRYDRAFWIGGSLFGMVLAGGDKPPETTTITLRIVARMRMIAAGRGLRVHFGTAWVGPRAERPEAVLQRAADSLLVARG